MFATFSRIAATARGACLLHCLIALLCLALLGCGPARPARVPVSGQVLIDGEPLRYGYVRFVPEGARPSGGQLDAEGRFTLACYDDTDGAVPGRHRVEIAAGETVNNGMKWHAPKRLKDVNTSGLEFTIDGPTDDLRIEISWEGGKPFVEKQ